MKTNQLLLLLAAYSALTGCGQPGPLYLPGTAPPIHVELEPKPKSEPEPEKSNYN